MMYALIISIGGLLCHILWKSEKARLRLMFLFEIKKNRGKKLDKQEEEIFKNNKDEILLGKKFDSGTTEVQNAIQDEIRALLGKR